MYKRINRHSIPQFIIVCITTLLLCSCVAHEQSTDSLTTKKDTTFSSNYSSNKWSVILSVSGGIKGVSRNISVDSNGLLIINDLKLNKSFRDKVNKEKMIELNTIIEKNVKFSEMNNSNKLTTKCRDCLSYKLSIRWDDLQRLAVSDDLNIHKSPYNKLIDNLLRLDSKKY